ncbi:MAG: CRTAC1 family protein [Isosphaeraceae bacterium]
MTMQEPQPEDSARPDQGGRTGPRRRRVLHVLFIALGMTVVLYLSVGVPQGLMPRPSSTTATATTTPRQTIPPRDLGKTRANPTVPVPPSPFRFAEVARESGISFVHASGMTEAKHFPTAYGSGVAMFDADGDGRMDLYFATATRLPVGSVPTRPNRLYRNLGGGRFVDATEQSGLGFQGYCQGLVVGDYDNDGDPDVYLCNYGSNVLYRNEGGGRFVDVTRAAGIEGGGWSTAGAFLDYDNDGHLDLYVARFGHWKLPDDDRFCGGLKDPARPELEKTRIYCSPRYIRPARHFLYHNNGDGTFTDVTDRAGVGRSDGRGLGVVAADLNDDGRIDLYVANDTCPNFLFLNRGDGTFEDATDSSGAGYDPAGNVRAGMGVDAEDVDGDGRPDLFVTNYFDEPNALFSNRGGGQFIERTRTSGMMHDSLPWVGWGCALADFDNDGWPDCFVTNGHVDDNLHLFGVANPYAQPALLHHNVGRGRFELATRLAGPYFDGDHVGRGVAHGDLDDDGDIDLVVNHKDAPPALLRNDTATQNGWIRVRLVGTRSNRDGIGAVVTVTVGDRTIVRHRKGGASYASAHDPRLLIGIGRASLASSVTVRWPSGQVDRLADVPAGSDLIVREGAPIVASFPPPPGRTTLEDAPPASKMPSAR